MFQKLLGGFFQHKRKGFLLLETVILIGSVCFAIWGGMYGTNRAYIAMGFINTHYFTEIDKTNYVTKIIVDGDLPNGIAGDEFEYMEDNTLTLDLTDISTSSKSFDIDFYTYPAKSKSSYIVPLLYTD